MSRSAVDSRQGGASSSSEGRQSLVKFNDPVMVTRNSEKKSPGARKLAKESEPMEISGKVVDERKGMSGDFDSGAAGQVEETLNSILPPKQWMEDGQLWLKQVKSDAATRKDVSDLSEELTKQFIDRQARDNGICPIRRELYVQAFDELIRQITIDCVERGLLLLRVRDEISMTIKAYQTLYHSSVAFGTRKAIEADSGKVDNEERIKVLESEKRILEKEVNQLKAQCESIEKREQERRQVDEKKRTEEQQFLKRTNQQLKQQVDGISNKNK